MSGFNGSALVSEHGDCEFVRELARLLIDVAPSQVDAVRLAAAAADAAALRAAAHRLLGSLSPFGAREAVEAARRLEAMGMSGDLTGVDDFATALVTHVQDLCAGAARWLDANT